MKVDVTSGSFMVPSTAQLQANRANACIDPPVIDIISTMQTVDVLAFRYQSIRFDYFAKNTLQWIGRIILWSKEPGHPISTETLDFFRNLVGFFAFIFRTHPMIFLSDRDFQKPNQKTKKQEESRSFLTPQECKVLNLIIKGKKHREAADSLHISVRTVDKHVENILKKTNTHSIIEAMKELGLH